METKLKLTSVSSNACANRYEFKVVSDSASDFQGGKFYHSCFNNHYLRFLAQILSASAVGQWNQASHTARPLLLLSLSNFPGLAANGGMICMQFICVTSDVFAPDASASAEVKPNIQLDNATTDQFS